MKIIFLSDIHGIYNNLNIIDRVIQDKKIDKVVVLGDLYYFGDNYSNSLINNLEVKNFLIKYRDKLICMKGNCDSNLVVKLSEFPIHSDISKINVDDLVIYITHGNQYSLKRGSKFAINGILVYGHEHIPYIETREDMVYINVGSISLPRKGLPTYMIYENRKFIIYDINGNIVDQIEL